MKKIFLIILTIAITLNLTACCCLTKSSKSTSAKPECPNFIGMSFEEIEEHEYYKSEYLVFKFEYVNDEDYEINMVCDQSIDAGEIIEEGTEITLSISTGRPNIKVPDVYGWTETKAISELESMGFTVAVVEEPSEDIESGYVIKTSPVRTQIVSEDEEITVYVSTGKEEKEVRIPSDIIGLSKSKAVIELEKLGLVVIIEERDLASEDKYYDKGYVFAVNPNVNTKINEGDKVTIYVSTGVVNYKFSPSVNIRSDFYTKSATGYISLWRNGEKIAESNLINFEELSTYTFKNLTGTDKNIEYSVKVRFGEDSKYYSFAIIRVDASKDKTTEISKKNDYKDYNADN